MLLLIYREPQLAGVLEFVNQSVVYGEIRIFLMSSCISSPPYGTTLPSLQYEKCQTRTHTIRMEWNSNNNQHRMALT